MREVCEVCAVLKRQPCNIFPTTHHSPCDSPCCCAPQEEHIMETTGPEDDRLEAIYERLEELDPSTFEAKVQ